MSRRFSKDDEVTFGAVPIRAVKLARDIQRTGILLRPSPGGRYDSGDLWVVQMLNGQETIVSESLMTVVDC